MENEVQRRILFLLSIVAFVMPSGVERVRAETELVDALGRLSVASLGRPN